MYISIMPHFSIAWIHGWNENVGLLYLNIASWKLDTWQENISMSHHSSAAVLSRFGQCSNEYIIAEGGRCNAEAY
jgi:hypothetical protein